MYGTLRDYCCVHINCSKTTEYFDQVPALLYRYQEVALETQVGTWLLIAILVFLASKIWKHWSYSKAAMEKSINLGFELAQGRRKKEIVNRLREMRKIGSIPPPYPNGWFMLLESSDLKDGQAIEVCILGTVHSLFDGPPYNGFCTIAVFTKAAGEIYNDTFTLYKGLNLVAWRGESGKSYVADAYCPHLGAHLGVGGTVKSDCIVCPFHGWQYEGVKGKLVNIPYAQCSESSLNSMNVALKMHRSLEQNGFIYLWHHAEGEAPTWTPDLFEDVKTGRWRPRGRLEYQMNVHIQDILENEADVNHLDLVHGPGLISGFEPCKSLGRFLDFVTTGYQGKWTACKETGKRHICGLVLNVFYILFGFYKCKPVTINIIQEGPALVTVNMDIGFFKAVLFYMITPVEPMTQRIVQRFYCSRWIPSLITTFFLENTAIMVCRDAPLWNRKTHWKAPCLPKEDSAIKIFRSWYSQFYSENSRRHFDGDKHLMEF